MNPKARFGGPFHFSGALRWIATVAMTADPQCREASHPIDGE
jgi:hypothetical protein